MTASRIVIAAFVGLWSASAFGQAPPAPANNTNSPDQQVQPASGPNRGPIDNRLNKPLGQGDPNDPNAVKNGDATMNPAETPTGPDIVDDPNATPEQKASAEYSGPAVLSRGIASAMPMNPKNLKFLPSVGLSYVLNSGLTGVAPQANGQLSNATSSGVQLTYGITGEKVLKKDTFSLSFHGDLYHYTTQSYLDGSDDSLSMIWSHRISRHFSFGVQVSAVQYDRNNLLLNGAQFVDSSIGTTLVTATPATEVFDGRVISLATTGDVTYQMNSRLSINLSGGGFLTRRRSSSLYGKTGSDANADVAYRITRQITTGAYYGYTHFDFTGTYGATSVNTVGLDYSIAFNPRTELSARMGASRLETTGLSAVSLDPILALVFGTGSVLEAIYRVNYAPDFNLQLRRKVSNLALSLAYARGITPGNGVILTSTRQSATGGINYQLKRYWDVSASSGWDTLRGFGATNQHYSSVLFDGSVSRKILKALAWNAHFGYHHYLFDSTNFLRNSYVFSTGVEWNPGNLLDRVW